MTVAEAFEKIHRHVRGVRFSLNPTRTIASAQVYYKGQLIVDILNNGDGTYSLKTSESGVWITGLLGDDRC